MITKKQLDAPVLASIQPFLGRVLRRVTYACLPHEATQDDVYAPDFYFGGEVVLHFEDMQHPLVITWDENAGWEEHFSVQARTCSAFNPGYLEPIDASQTPVWDPHIGHTLTGFQLLGFDSSPQVIVLRFVFGNIFVGCGYETRFGDGDDIIVRASETATLHPNMVSLYEENT